MNMKAAATLTGSLLARKGAAYPAAYAAPSTSDGDGAQPQRAYNDPRVIASAAHAVETGAPAAATPAAATPAASPGGTQMQDGRFVSDMPQQQATPAVDAGDDLSVPQAMDKMGRVRLSVRLDPDRYLRVKMASARTRWSAQDIVIAALDRYLGGAAGGGKPESSDDEGSVN